MLGGWERWLTSRDWDRTAALFAVLTLVAQIGVVVYQVLLDRKRARQEVEEKQRSQRMLFAVERTREIQEIYLREGDEAAELTNADVQVLRMIESMGMFRLDLISRQDPRNSWFFMSVARLHGRTMITDWLDGSGAFMTVRGYEMIRKTRARQFVDKPVFYSQRPQP